jgi:hypothetical protein
MNSMRICERDELRKTVDAAFCMLMVGVKLDYSMIKITSENLENIACLLRSTSTIGQPINGYRECLEQAIKVAIECGIDVNDIFFGMLNFYQTSV